MSAEMECSTRAQLVNQLAVAEVLANHLWDSPRHDRDLDIRPRQLKDTVWRAMSGEMLSKATLNFFTAAFRMEAGDVERSL